MERDKDVQKSWIRGFSRLPTNLELFFNKSFKFANSALPSTLATPQLLATVLRVSSVVQINLSCLSILFVLNFLGTNGYYSTSVIIFSF